MLIEILGYFGMAITLFAFSRELKTAEGRCKGKDEFFNVKEVK